MGHLGLAILVPVRGRPHRVKPLVDSITRTTPDPWRVVFIADPSDTDEQEAVREDGRGELMVLRGGWGHKINRAARRATEPLLFLGADDLEFKPGWLEAAVAKLGGGIGVVGVNDLLRRKHRPEHATHFLMTRAYAMQGTIDGRPGPVCERYHHWRCDDELIATALKRGAYAYAADSHVAHLHPMAGTARDDDTYKWGRSQIRTDNAIFRRRERLWT